MNSHVETSIAHRLNLSSEHEHFDMSEEIKDRPFQCTTCGKRFRQACHLQQHIRIHTNERPYHCQFCEKKFKQKSQVNQHERIHTGEKPYECPLCYKAFHQAGQLYSHKKSHGINPKVPKSAKESKGTRKAKSNQPMIVSSLPIVYLMESLTGLPTTFKYNTVDSKNHPFSRETTVKLEVPEITEKPLEKLPKPTDILPLKRLSGYSATSCNMPVGNVLPLKSLNHNSGNPIGVVPEHLQDLERLIPADHGSYQFHDSQQHNR